MALKSHACCTVRGIFRRCLNKPQIVAREADPAKACNQDDATASSASTRHA
jgi:hypothetical protein